MLRKFAAALLVTALIAGPALAAQPTAGGSGPAVTSAATPSSATKHAKLVKHVRKHARHQAAKVKTVRHIKFARRHHHRLATHIAKPTKPVNGGNTNTRG